MPLVILIAKTEIAKDTSLHSEIVAYCHSVAEKEDGDIYLPLPGHLMAVVNILMKYNISYALETQRYRELLIAGVTSD